jgi:hypothetical protein
MEYQMKPKLHAWEILLPNIIWFRTGVFSLWIKRQCTFAEDDEDKELTYLDSNLQE